MTIAIHRRNLVSACVTLMALLVFAAPGKAGAEENTYRFDIPAQQLDSALRAFARASHQQVAFRDKAVQGKRNAALKGNYTAREALQQLLSGSGLSLREGQSGLFIVGDPSTASQPTGARAASEGQLRFALVETSLPQGKEVADAPSQATVAQGEDQTSDEDKSRSTKESQEVVVTGSRLRGVSTSTASPITIITQEDIKRQGLNNIEDIIRSLPQVYSEVNAAASLDNSINSVDARGQTDVNLRGFGAQNTLVLVDGRRWASSPTFLTSTVNVNTIPSGAIERVEVMLDGASAIYGSDAAGGVINFILKKNYQGAESSVTYQNSATGGDSYAANQLVGLTWGSGSVTGSVRYERTKAINARRMGVSTNDFTSLGGHDQRESTVTQPGNVDGLGSLPIGDDGTHGVAGKLSPSNMVPYDSAADGASAYLDLTGGGQNLTFDVDIRQNISDRISLYANVSHANNTSESRSGAPSAYYLNVPTTNRFNDTGSDQLVSYIFVQELKKGQLRPVTFTSNQNNTNAMLGFKVDLPFKDWTADLSGSRSSEEGFFYTIIQNDALMAERAAGVDAQGNPLPAAQHLNLFGNGTAQDPAALAGLVGPGVDGWAPSDSVSNAQSAGLVLEGSLFTLPGGAVRLAAGGERRADDLDYGDNANYIDAFGLANPKRSIHAEYMEASIPVVGEKNRLPGVYSMNLSAAARAEKYSFSGPFDGPTSPTREESFKATTPKVGLAWFPVPDIKLRATWGKSFRAPDLYRLFSPQSGPYHYGFFAPDGDPQNPGAPFDPLFYFGGNPALQPEKSRNTAIGVDWRPAGVLHGLYLSLTYNKIDLSNEISSTSILLDFLRGYPEAFFQDPRLVVRDSNNMVTRVNLKAINLSARSGDSYDFNGMYDFDTTAGAFTVGVDGTYTNRLEDVFFPGATPSRVSGTQAGPEKLKMRGRFSWTRGNYGTNLFVNYSSGYYNTSARGYPGMDGSVSSYTTVDLTGSYKVGSLGLEFNGGAKNLFNADFPFFDGFGVPWDPRRVDLRRRILYVNIVKKFGLAGSR